MAGNLFSGKFFTLYCPFNFPTPLFVLSGCIPSSSLNTVLLVVLEHRSIFLAAVICIVFSSWFTNFAFPSHTSAYSNFGTITFLRIHILILVSRCGSVSIAPILPTCERGGGGAKQNPPNYLLCTLYSCCSCSALPFTFQHTKHQSIKVSNCHAAPTLFVGELLPSTMLNYKPGSWTVVRGGYQLIKMQKYRTPVDLSIRPCR